jgi:UDP-N-acetylglucosamine acyltransferase
VHGKKDRQLIHPTALVDPSARAAEGVEIGAYSVIDADVELGVGCRIGPHVVIRGPTRIGAGTRIYQFASIGEDPQDKKYGGEPTRLEIGERNTVREYVTINRGTVQDRGLTRVGDDNWIMAGVHIAHDCDVGDHTVLANGTTLAGHVKIGDHAVLGGYTLVHQFCRIGQHAFTAYGARLNKDVPPFVRVSEGRSRPRGINAEGLKRRGFDEAALKQLREAYRILYRSGLTLEAAIDRLRAMETEAPVITPLRRFLQNSDRSILR